MKDLKGKIKRIILKKPNWYPRVDDKLEGIDNKISEITTLINENYYPKEYVEWLFDIFFFDIDNDIYIKFKNMTEMELYKYWTNNIKEK